VPSMTRRSSMNRNALVFEREITVRNDGDTRRWSIAVPARDMDNDMVEMMLELQDLSAFFKNDPTDNSVCALPSPAQDPPSLMLSNSHFAMPISMSSSCNLETRLETAPVQTLASRRGKKELQSLTISTPTTEEECSYPDIPTAFVGTPSALSPSNFGGSLSPEPNMVVPMSLEEMIGALRLRCAPLQPVFTTSSPVIEAEVAVLGTTPSSIPVEEHHLDANNVSVDEWEFARGLNEDFGEDMTLVLENAMLGAAAGNINELLLSLTGDMQAPSNLLSDSLAEPASVEQECLPDVALLNGGSPRSILKNRKSVRFASLPSHGVQEPTASVAALPLPIRPDAATSPPARETIQPTKQSFLGRSIRQPRGTKSLIAESTPTRRGIPIFSSIAPRHKVIPPKSPNPPATPSLQAAGRPKPASTFGRSSRTPKALSTLIPVSPPPRQINSPTLPARRKTSTPLLTIKPPSFQVESHCQQIRTPLASVDDSRSTPTTRARASTLGRHSLRTMKGFGGSNLTPTYPEAAGKENRGLRTACCLKRWCGRRVRRLRWDNFMSGSN
jgi:hypothetical protein